MAREIIRGTKALAEHLGVSDRTVRNWRASGLLDKATVADYGRVIIYDLEKVYECLRYPSPGRGRRTRTA